MNNIDARNKRVVQIVSIVIIGMVALSFASVPLYRMFCQATGFGGTTQTGGAVPKEISSRIVTISFDARTDAGLPWKFKPEARHMDVHVGQQAIASFDAVNLSARTTTGTAVYNVTPQIVGKYFHKTQCFCFAQQELAPGKSAQFPVMFYVDPEFASDPEMKDITDITLSYTFFATDSKALDKAIETYGEKK